MHRIKSIESNALEKECMTTTIYCPPPQTKTKYKNRLIIKKYKINMKNILSIGCFKRHLDPPRYKISL